MSDEKDPNDPKDIESMRKFAEELAAKMKSGEMPDPKAEYSALPQKQEDHDAPDHDKDTCPFCSVPKEREKLLRTLESDVDALGWDQPAKVWGVLVDEETGEEYLKLLRTLDGYAPKAIKEIAKRGKVKESVKGVVVAVEAWSYPDETLEPMLEDPQSFQALYNLLPPSEHPQRVERRAVSMFNRDGTYACVTRARGGEPQLLAAVDPAMAPAVAALLGMDGSKMTPEQRKRALQRIVGPMRTMHEISHVLEEMREDMEETCRREGITQEEYIRRLFEEMPDDIRKDLVDNMPPELKKMLGL